MLVATLMLALAQAPAPLTLMEGGWVGADVDQKQVTLWNEVLFAELTRLGVQVRTQADVAQVLGLERQKQLLGCGDDAGSCVAELAQALDADGIIRGSTGRSGSSLVLNVRVVSATGEPLAVKSAVVPTADAALAELPRLAEALVDALAPRFPGRLAPRVKATPGARRFWWLPAAGAVVLTGVGVGLQMAARGVAGDVRAGVGLANLTAVDDAIARGRSLEVGSFIAFGLAGAAAVSAVLVWWLGADADPSPVTLAPVPGGVVLVGRWP